MDLATARRHAVLSQFIRPYQSHEDIRGFDAEAMADRIVRLERIIHALRQPSGALVEATAAAEGPLAWPTRAEADRAALRWLARRTIATAVAAAELEVDA